MFISEITALLRSRNVEVTIDQALVPNPEIATPTYTRNISVNLFKLIYAIGTIQTRRFAPSNRQKFSDKADLLEKLVNGNDLCIKITEIRNRLGHEVLGDISEDFGVGISVTIVDQLFNIKYSTIQRIYGQNIKRCDWECKTSDNRTIAIECKGASSQATSNTQRANAIVQKNTRQADVKIASLTVIKENQISTNHMIDPPSRPSGRDPELESQILKAGHYSSVFSFLGHSGLSRYFSRMRKRIASEISPSEQEIKEMEYTEILNFYPRIEFREKSFAGTYYEIDDSKILFIGIDISLVSFVGFRAFIEYDSDIDVTERNNHFMLYRDGVIIIEILNSGAFHNLIPRNIRSYQENITISDIDEMNDISFQKYFVYLLQKLEFEVRQEVQRIDIVATRNGQTFLFELKVFRDENAEFDFNRIIGQLSSSRLNGTPVLVTNQSIREGIIRIPNNVVVIDREALKDIIKRQRHLFRYLGAN